MLAPGMGFRKTLIPYATRPATASLASLAAAFHALIKTYQTTLESYLIAVTALAEFGTVIEGKLPELRIGCV
jgi:hypothetical protein